MSEEVYFREFLENYGLEIVSRFPRNIEISGITTSEIDLHKHGTFS